MSGRRVTIEQARAAILTTLTTAVSASAMVHDYFRHTNDPKAYGGLFVKNGRLHTWMIELADADPFLTVGSTGNMGRNPGSNPVAERAFYNFTIYGYYAWNDADASAKAFPVVVESIFDAFRADPKLGGIAIDSGPCQWRDGRPVMFPPRGEGSALCHHAKIDLRVNVWLSPD